MCIDMFLQNDIIILILKVYHGEVYVLIQRLGNNQVDPKYIEEFISIVTKHKGCCDEVWLSTLYGFPSIEKHKETARLLALSANKLRESGIKVSLQISNTIGHGAYMASQDCSGLVNPKSNAEKMVGINGEINDYCFCWNGKTFKQYTIDMMLAYACVNPENIWIDDDLRIFNHSPIAFGCFCDNCIQEFNKEYGHSFTRDQLKEKLLYTDVNVRIEYFNFIKESFGKFVYEICRAFAEKCKDANFGFQYGDEETAVLLGSKFVLDNIFKATGKAPMTRPGGGHYNDYDISSLVNKCMHINFLNSKLPEYVNVKCPEIENTPDVVFGKSIPGTCLETALYLAYGNNQMSYAAMMRTYEPMSFYDKLLSEFSKRRRFWEKLVELNLCTVQSGLMYIFAQSNMTKKLNVTNVGFHAKVYSKLNGFLRTAIPISFENNTSDVYLLDDINALYLNEKELDSLKTKNVIMDAKAFKIVNDKLKVSNICVEEMESFAMLTHCERFVQHEVNNNLYGKKWEIPYWSQLTTPCVLLNTEGAEIISDYVLEQDGNKKLGVSTCVIDVAGKKWAIFANDFWNCTISMDKRNQILNVAEYLSRDSVKTVIISEHQGILIPRENVDGKITSVSYFNYTLGEQENISIKIKQPAGERFKYYDDKAEELALNAEKIDDFYIITLKSIPAFSIGTIAVK